jgi:hypothetical protein
VLFLPLFLLACESSRPENQYDSIKKDFHSNNILDGLITTEHMLKLHPQDPLSIKAAQEAESVCVKDAKTCSDREEVFLKFIIEKSNKEQDQITAQKRLCEIYYDKGLYPQVIIEMNRLLSKMDFKDGRLEMRLKLARTNFYIKNFYQAQVELKAYLKEAATDEEKFDGYLLQADIQSADKKYTDAMQTYQYIQEHFKALYLKNQVYMNEVLLMEEQKQLDQAIGVLEELKPQVENNEFIQIKIDRLKERKALMPGASGLKR